MSRTEDYFQTELKAAQENFLRAQQRFETAEKRMYKAESDLNKYYLLQDESRNKVN